jgi:hypothetical protein
VPARFLTPEQIIAGPPLDPVVRVRTYSADEFEGLIQDWAYYYLQASLKIYCLVVRTGGSGDKGRDVVGYCTWPPAGRDYDIFQCKHYHHPLHPAELWVEFGKLCLFTFEGTIKVPRSYQIVAPHDVGPSVLQLLESPGTIGEKLVAEWPTRCQGEMRKPDGVPLTDDLKRHILDFDFTIVKSKPIHEVVGELRQTPCFAPRFGGGLQVAPPIDPVPPDVIQPNESRYVAQLVEAYRDESRDDSLDLADVPTHDEFGRHFTRSRERFYCAESVERFARDALVGGQGFSDVRDQVLDAVIDVAEDQQHSSGYRRVVAVTDQAARTPVVAHPLRSYIKIKCLQGICHQLANEDRLTWVPKKKS